MIAPECNGDRASLSEETEHCTRCGGSGLVRVADPAEERANGDDPAPGRWQPRALAVTGWKSALERRPGALEGTLNGGFAGLEHVRDLRRSETEHVAQHQHRALSRWQVVEGGHKRQAYCLLELIAHLRSGRGIGDRVEEGAGVWLQPDRLAAARGLRRLGERHPGQATSLVPQSVQRAIGRDAIKPRAQRGSPVEALEPAPGGQQCLLEMVLGVLDRAEDAVANAAAAPRGRGR
jgi:hypothetical protein